ncbi:MAG: biotin--[acetyl-CoA-carboxylase] ligase [Burkholderiales bacterium]|nr:biotin--[acetyl-CoA-carboxylase] ligase [Burkholderiales bacterium]
MSDGRIYSYKTLTTKLNCTFLSLFETICVASHLGIEIQRVNGISLYWDRSFVWLNEDTIYSYLNDRSSLFGLTKFDLLDSTNSYLYRNKSLYLKYDPIPVIVSELQVKGRGTKNRCWISNLGGCLTFSVLWQFKRKIQHLSTLSLVLGVCLIRVFRNFTCRDVQLKWPNDILYNKKKFAGILVECGATQDNSVAAIIGIGINFQLSLNQVTTIDYAVTDLFEISGRAVDRNHILALLLIELHRVLSTFEINGFSVFRDEWDCYHAYQGHNILLSLPDRSIVEGIVDGVQDDGSLVLKTSSGRKNFSVGEVSFKVKT